MIPRRAALLALVLLSGCVTATVEQRRTRPLASVGHGERIAVLGRRAAAEYQTERDFVGCIRDALAGDGLAVMGEEEFADWMYPWFEPRTAPTDVEALAARLRDRTVAERLAETRIRYVVWIDGRMRDGDDGGGIVCGVGPFGSCLGLMWWEEIAGYEASVWDLRALASMGKVTVDASGTSYVPAVMLPIPLIARTESAACDGVATQLGEFLRAGEAGESPADERPATSG